MFLNQLELLMTRKYRKRCNYNYNLTDNFQDFEKCREFF